MQCPSNITQLIMSKGMRWAAHVACVGEDKHTEFWWVNFKASDHSEDLGIGKVRPTTCLCLTQKEGGG